MRSALMRRMPLHGETYARAYASPFPPRHLPLAPSLEFSACLDADTTHVSFHPDELNGTAPDVVARFKPDPSDPTKARGGGARGARAGRRPPGCVSEVVTPSTP